ncbi:hypothetical protein ABZX95_38275 [Streptomyces sp. NPDC004232]|uniref:hypothetical protein n=1 Tax=Streptomyces sp. NPDC004232 TaxID=3154454 RepID=UPI0033ACEDC0
MYASPDDKATAHLLVAAAFHEAAAKAEEQGDLSILRFSQAVLRHFDEHSELQGRLYDVVRGYAEKHASFEEQAALDRWIAEKTNR